MKMALSKSIRDEKGQALVLALVLLLIGGLIIAPLLSYMSTGLKVGKEVYENKMYEFYAADAGIEDALWHLQSTERILQLDPTWDPYNIIGWSFGPYDMTDPGDPDKPDDINDKEVDVTIWYAWLLEGLDSHDPTSNVNDQVTVIAYYNTDDNTNYIVDFTSKFGDKDVERIGVWLPPGYDYVDDSVEINGVAIGEDPLVTNPDDSTPYRGGTALLWDFSDASFQELSEITPPLPPGGHPPAEKFPPTVRLSFNFTYPPGVTEADLFFPWIIFDGDIAWDIGVGFYHIESVGKTSATKSTTVETYTPWGIPRQTTGSGGVSSSIQGDYIVIGNSLMTCCWNAAETGPPVAGEPCCTSCDCCGDNPYRNYAPAPAIFTGTNYPDAERESSATVNSSGAGAVPADAKIERAYLYWTAWLRGDWLWTESGQTWNSSWNQYMGDDTNWEAHAPQYVKDWLKVNAYDGNAYLAVNGTKVTPKNAGDPAGTVVAGNYYISEGSSDVQPSYQYACFADVTAQVTAIRTALVGANFTVAGVHAHPAESCADSTWNRSSNAGWSLIIIYSSEEKDSHQIYLYAGCDHLYQQSHEFTITGFETPPAAQGDNEAKMTVFASEGDDGTSMCKDFLKFKGQNTNYYDLRDVTNTTCVFNSMSSAGGFTPSAIKGQAAGTISGVDIDTYTRTRPSGGTPLSTIVQPGDTSAKINVGSNGDGFELIYVVFSVRSTLVGTGEEFEVGTMTYEIS